MALYAKDITQSVEPAQANVATLGKGIEARAEGARLSANATGTMLKAAGYLAEQYVAYDVGKIQAEAEQVTSEFLDKGMQAEKAAQDMSLVAAQRDKLAATGTSYSVVPDAETRRQAAIGRYDEEIKRLKDAAAGGMSNEEYVSRVSALTRKAIAKYPGLADSIREKVGAITGLPYADRWAEMQYVKERFTKQQADTDAMSPEKMAIKDMDKVADIGTFGNREQLYTLYKKDRPQYDARMQAANEHLATKTGVDTLTKGISGLQAQSDFDADKLRGSFVAMFQGHLGSNVTSASVSNMENLYTPVLAMMAKGDNINVNPAAFDVQIKMHNAQMKTNIEQARIASINEIDKYLANNPNITSSKRDQMKADVNSAADLQLRMYADDKGVGLAAMSAIMSTYRDKSLKEKKDLIDLAIKQQSAMQNNSLVMAYWAGGKQRENLELTNKDFYNFMVKQEEILLSNTQGITNNSAGQDALANVTKVLDAASKSPDAVVPSPDVKPEETKAAISAMNSATITSLDKAVKGTLLTPIEQNVISSTLSTNVQTGANSQILANDYKKMGDKIRLLPVENQAIIKDNVSKAARNNVMAMSSLKEGLENKHGVTLKLGVTPSGQIMAMQTPLSEKEMSALRNGGQLSEQRRQAAAKEEAAVIEFNKQSKPLLSNLVFSRAMLTDENPVAIANEFALMFNNKQTYNGFYDNKAVAPVANLSDAQLEAQRLKYDAENEVGVVMGLDVTANQPPPIPVLQSPAKGRTQEQADALYKKQVQDVKDWYNRNIGTNTPVTSNVPADKSKVVKFNPEGDGYDYETARKYGMGADGTGENAGHWGSVAPASKEDKQKYKLPDESYVILKGRKHETWQKAVNGEQERGFEIKKFGNRYFSVPVNKENVVNEPASANKTPPASNKPATSNAIDADSILNQLEGLQ
jgi:hypothetical protein